ncbi:hypothetical protein [Priestia aryabhattai]
MTEDSSSGNNNSRKNNPESKRNYDVFAALNEAFVIQEGKSKDFLNFVNEKKAASQRAMDKARAFAKENKKCN